MPFTPGIEVEVKPGTRLVFVAGCTALPLYHKHPHDPVELTPPEDVKEQTRRVLENIKMILAASGATLNDIVKATRYLTDMADQDAVNEVWKEYFPGERPTTTTVQVAGLVMPGLKIEIDAIAAVNG